MTQFRRPDGSGSDAAALKRELASVRTRAAEHAHDAQRYFHLLQSIDAIVYEFDFEANAFRFVNDHAEKLLGYPLAEWLTPGFLSEHIHPEDRAESVETCLRFSRELRDHALEFRLIASDGRAVWVHDVVTVERDEEGRIILRGAMVDVTPRKRAEQQFRDVSARLHTMLEGFSIGVVFQDVDERVTFVNQAALRVLGWTDAASVIGKLRHDLVRDNTSHIGDGDALNRVMDAIVARGEVAMDKARQMADGRWVERMYIPMRMDGKLVGHLWKIEDVTERKRLERGLRMVASATAPQTGREFFRVLVRNLAEALGVRWALVGEVCDESRARMRTLAVWSGGDFAENLEYEIAGAPCEALFSAGAQRVDGDLQARFGKHAFIRALGAQSYLGVPLATSNRSTFGVLAVLHDGRLPEAAEVQSILEIFAARAAIEIERSAALEALSQLEFRNRAILRAIPDRMLLYDANDVAIHYHSNDDSQFLYPPSMFLGHRPRDYMSAEHAELIQSLIARARELGEVQTAEVSLVKDGQSLTLELRAATTGDRGHVLMMARDITERRRLEDELAQSQKLESIGRLAGGIAHDFNNLLTGILGFTELAQSRARDSVPVGDYFEKIRAVAERASGLTQQLLAFARKQIVAPRLVSLEDLVREMQPFLRRLIGEHIELVTKLAPNAWRTRIDPMQFHQILINLTANARDAMRDGGRVTISVVQRSISSADVARGETLEPGDWIELCVADDGVGMSAETQAHIFEPFYTTKDVGHGTGMGLAICYGIVRQHGGHVRVASAVGHGTQIRVLLPRAEAIGGEEHTQARHVEPHGRETVLLVEDDASVREVLAQTLARLGYRVLEACDGDEALVAAASFPGAIDALVTDVVMPAMGGPPLADRLRATRRDLRVLFMSGYTADAVDEERLARPGTAFLRKPFTPRALVEQLRATLDAPPSSASSANATSPSREGRAN